MARARFGPAALNRLLQSSPRPIYILDADRRIIFCNKACGRWLGVAPDDLAGLRCDYHSAESTDEKESTAALLCPPPEAFAGARTTGTIARSCADGEIESRQAEFLPILAAGEEVRCGVIVGVLGPVAAAEQSPSEEPSPAELHLLLVEHGRRLGQAAAGLLVGESPELRRARRQYQLAVATTAETLIVAPAGSYKERLARAIHYARTGRGRGRLVPVPCRLIDAETLQAAIRDFKRAAGGEQPATLLLLDVDQLPEVAQSELAGFLNLPGFRLPVVATAEMSLAELSRDGTFRRDLSSLLGAIEIVIPPLATRLGDLPLLTQSLLESQNARGGPQLSGFSAEALDRLAAYSWPGDVAELAEMIEAICEFKGGKQGNTIIGAGDLPRRIALAEEAAAHPSREAEPIDLDAFLAELEEELIRRALHAARGNKTKAAELLGITRARLHRRLEDVGDD